MYLHVKDGKAEVLSHEDLKHYHQKETDPTSCHAIVERIEDELDGWCEYKELYAKTGEAGHRTASEQEFQHLLLAISDLIHALYKKQHLTDHERTEMDRLLGSLVSMKTMHHPHGVA